jgi:prevent-host-death family protein
MVITTTDIQNNFGKYLKLAEYEDVIITKNGKKKARLSIIKEEEDQWVFRELAPDYAASNVKVSYQEFLKLTEESEHRYELIDGEVYFLASPLYPHQKAVKEILAEFVSWFRDKKCEPLAAPFDVTLFKSEKNICVVQPDILVICDREKIDKKGRYTGVPSLVVEVLSESTNNKDNTTKLQLYMSAGIQEYWLVNTKAREIYIYVFENKDFSRMLSFGEGKRAESQYFKGLGVDLKRVFV